MSIYKIRDCYLNLIERRVLRDGQFLDLTPKTFDVLKLLFERRGKVVTKDEILGEVWNGSYVEESNLPVHVSKVRRALDAMNYQHYIETVQGSGYRFVAPVDDASQSEWDEMVAAMKPPPPKSSRWKFDSIAILPLFNEAQTEEYQYLADGLTESFINSLSRLSGLRVMARNTAFKYKNKVVDPKDVGDTLGVAVVMTGRLRVVKEKVVIAIELTKTEDGSNLWGTKLYDHIQSLVDLQEAAIDGITQGLTEGIVKERNRIYNAGDEGASESYRLLLKGRFFNDKGKAPDIRRALSYFERSSAKNPGSVVPYVESVEAYYNLYFSDYATYDETLSVTTPIIEHVISQGVPHDSVEAMMGGKAMYLDWKFEIAEQHLRRAIEMNPSNLVARYRLSNLMLIFDKRTEALSELQSIDLIEPLSVQSRIKLGRTYYKMGRFDCAKDFLTEAVEMDESNYVALLLLAATNTELGDLDEAVKLAGQSMASNFNIETLSFIGYLHALKGDRVKAEETILKLNSAETRKYDSAMRVGKIYLALGDKTRAFELLNESIDRHDVDVISLNNHPIWQPFREDPLFLAAKRKIGLPSNRSRD